MSTQPTTSTEENFATKGGYEMIAPSTLIRLIELCAGTSAVVCAIGPSGIGKTAIPAQVARQRNDGKGVPYVPIYMPTAQQEGFFIPTTAADTKAYFDQRIPRTFEKLLDWANLQQAAYGVDPVTGKHRVPKDKCPILAIEELNRAVDKAVTRAAFTLIGDRMIGDVKLPDCVQIVATMNPTGNGMNVNEFEKDPAMRRRLLQVGVDYAYGDFIAYAMQAKFHPNVLDYLGAHPSHGYDVQAALASKAFACPATWETVSKLCYQFDAEGLHPDTALGRAAVAGAIGATAATTFLDFVRHQAAAITPNDVLLAYAPGTPLQQRLLTYTKADTGRLDKVTDLILGVATYIYADVTRPVETYAPQLAYFFNDLPEELLSLCLQRLITEAKTSEQKDLYFTQLNVAMAAQPACTEALERIANARARAHTANTATT